MFELVELYEALKEIYEAYGEAVLDYRKLGDRVARKQHDLDVEKAKLYEQGLINGKNVEAREAQVVMYLVVQFEELDVLKEMEGQAKIRMEYLGLEVEKLRALLRVEEVAANTGERLRYASK